MDYQNIRFKLKEGSRANCSVLLFTLLDKQIYVKNKILKLGETAYVCRVKSCKARVYLSADKSRVYSIPEIMTHNHGCQSRDIEKLSVLSEIKRKCRNNKNEDTKKIFNDVLAEKTSGEGEIEISYDSVKRTLQRKRRQPLPTSSTTPKQVRHVCKEENIMNLTEMTKVDGFKLGEILIEGKTKKVYDLPDHPGLCLLLSKDRITAGDGVKAHDLKGKAEISNTTNGQVFKILNEAGIRTAYVKPCSANAFIAKKCEMIPIEWVTRRLATGSFLKRNPGVHEGYRFSPPKQETFYKDDANHDPQWSDEQIISAKFKLNGVIIGQDEVDIMKRTTVVVFEILEKAWATRNCALIDMKIEFGIDGEGNIVLADIIDSDSWRLWPSGDKRLMVDKQVYRNLTSVTATDLDTVKRNFIWVSEQLKDIVPSKDHLVVILMGSSSDSAHSEKIASCCRGLGLNVELRVTSAHKAPEETLRIMREYESVIDLKLIFIAVAGRSNGLGPVLSGSTTYPVINCPPIKSDNMQVDVWSSLNLPSGLSCATVIYPETAALHAAQIIGLTNYMIWSKLRVKQLNNFITLKKADKEFRGIRNA